MPLHHVIRQPRLGHPRHSSKHDKLSSFCLPPCPYRTQHRFPAHVSMFGNGCMGQGGHGFTDGRPKSAWACHGHLSAVWRANVIGKCQHGTCEERGARMPALLKGLHMRRWAQKCWRCCAAAQHDKGMLRKAYAC
jgi:hypothetical protein